MAERGARRGFLLGAMAGALATGVLAVAAAVGAQGAPATPPIHVVVDGRAVDFPTSPLDIGGHVYLPIRYVAQALGLSVSWDQATETVYVGTPPSTGAATGGSFDYQGLHYATTGLIARQYPGQASSSGLYWIVSYSITNTSTQPVDVPKTQPPLSLFGPGGAQLAPAPGVNGPTAGTINPGITFSSYAVFNVPGDALASQYGLGFLTYALDNGQFSTTPLSASLPVPSSTQTTTQIEQGAPPYGLTGLWSRQVDLYLSQVTKTTEVVPDLSAASFDPTTTFWVVDFGMTNPTTNQQPISFEAGNFALQFSGDLRIGPSSVHSLPGYVPASGLDQPGGVTLAPGQSFSGALLFAVPAGTPTDGAALQVSVNGQTRVISLQPCSGNLCPPIED